MGWSYNLFNSSDMEFVFHHHLSLQPRQPPSSPEFKISPATNRARHRLLGLSAQWTEPSKEMRFVLRFMVDETLQLAPFGFSEPAETPPGDAQALPSSRGCSSLPDH